jgi:hypothetical protein
MDQPEEFEHVPWSELSAGMEQRRGRVAYVLAAVILAVAVGAVVARAVWPGSATGETVATAVPVTEPAAPAVAATTEPSTTLPAPALYSEADLLAASSTDASRAAVVRAEWFVTDYFTADLDPGGSLDLRRALPAGAELADLPQDAPSDGISYVEWARAMSVEVLGADLYRVDVVFRTIGGPRDGPFTRLPVRAVRVAVQGDGFGMAVVDLPSPASLPSELGSPPWPEQSGDLPEGVAAAALAAAGAWGDEPAVVGWSAAGNGWRVVVEADDAAANRWPLALWLDELGEIAAPPWLDARPG